MVKKSILLAAGLVFVHGLADAQQKMNSGSAYGGIMLPVSEGSVQSNLRGKGISVDEASKNLAAMLGLSSKHSFKKVAETKDELGITHTDFQQYYLNVKVDNGLVLVHSKDGIVNKINGKVAQLGTLSVTPALNEQEAAGIAKKAALINSQFKQYPGELVIATVVSEKNTAYALAWKVRIDGKTDRNKMVMTNVFVDAATGKILDMVSLLAHVDVTGTANTFYSGTRPFTIDSTAQGFRLRDNGRKIETYNATGFENYTDTAFFSSVKDYKNNTRDWGLFKFFSASKLQTASSDMLTGLGQTNILTYALFEGNISNPAQSSSTRFLPVSSPSGIPVNAPGFYSLIEPQQNYFGVYMNINVTTQNQNPDFAYYQMDDLNPGVHNWSDTSGNSGTYTIAMSKNPAVDAHWGMERTHDYYVQSFNRNSFDNMGSVIRNFVNTGAENNAGAVPAPYDFMVYGMGDGSYLGPVVALDVMGHEFTHMVTEHNGHGGLQYQGESGALNESFSDIFGTSIEFFAKGSQANWNIGEGVMLQNPGFLRSMSNPKLAQNPDTYQGQYWKDPNNTQYDAGGVHFNSGVQNKWYYLLVAGGSGTNDKGDAYNVTGIGMEKAQKITYRNLTNYLTPSSRYIDAYEGSLDAATDLYGANSVEYAAVKKAWFAVGIGTNPATAVNEIELTNNDLTLYPNPATGRVTISSKLNETLQAQVLNAVGVPVMNITVTKGLNPVDISTLAKGIYMIRYNTGAKAFVQKLSVL